MVEVGAGVVFVDVVDVRARRRKWRMMMMGFREVRAQEGGYLLGVSGFGEGGAQVGAVLMALLDFPFFVIVFFLVGSGCDGVVGR